MSNQPRPTGSINVKYGVEMELSINAIAARMGMQRNEWLRKLAQEALDADEEGRPLFQKMEGPRIDSSLNVLAADLRNIMLEWDRVQREHERRELNMIGLWTGGEEANRLAFEKLANRITKRDQESYLPFVQKITELIAGLNVVDERCAAAIDARLVPLAGKIANIEVQASTPRVVRNVVLGRGWFLSRWPLAVAAAVSLSLGAMAGLIIPGLSDATAVGQAGYLINSAGRMCRLVERQYNSIDCTLPATVRKAGRAGDMKEGDL